MGDCLRNDTYDENYEVELSEILLKTLKELYSMKSDNDLFLYLRVKHELIINSGYSLLGETEFFENTFIELIKDELKLKQLIFNNILFKSYTGENNYCNIIEDWKYCYEKNTVFNFKTYSFDALIEHFLTLISKNVLKESKRYKDSTIDLYLRLKELDKLFSIEKKKTVPKIDGFLYFDFENQLSINEKLEMNFFNKAFYGSSVGGLMESDVEKYFYRNLDKIEEGLTPVAHQFKIKDGFIDILAKDKNGKYVIIELKIKSDKSIIWQVLYYPKALKKELGNVQYRMITLAPIYDDSVYGVLKELDVEVLKYKVRIYNGELTDSVVIKL